MATLATLQSRLTEAETAYHNLLTGSLEERVGKGDLQVTYSRADADKLKQYIAQLKDEIEAAGSTQTGKRRRAMVVDL